MEPGLQPPNTLFAPNTTNVVLWGLFTAALMAAGTFFQKLNGVRLGHPLVSGWLALSLVCFFPTFPIANKVYLSGGRVSLFVPVTAATYVFSMLAGRFYFREEVSYGAWFGCVLIIAGVTAIARG